MDSHSTQSALYNFLGWADVNKKRLAAIVGAIAVVAAIVAFFIWHSSQREITASEALSELRPIQVSANSPGIVPASEYIRLADSNAKTAAGARARMLGAGALFTEGKYSEALQQFERLLADYSDSPLRPEATLGAAASLDAQGKLAEAVARYKEVTDRFPNSPSATHAKYGLARLYEIQNKPDMALKLYQELGRDELLGSISYSSQARAVELVQKNPSLKATAVPQQKLQ